MNKRLDFLKKQLFSDFFKKKDWWGDDLSIFDDNPDLVTEPIIYRKAVAFEKVCKEMPLDLKPQELIVGVPTMSSVGFGHTFPKYETDEEADKFEKLSLNRKSVWGHHMPYYPKILQIGIDGVIQEVKAARDALAGSDLKKDDFYRSVLYTLESAKLVPQRYVTFLENEIKDEANPERKQELEQIIDICKKVPAGPAESFQEALQSVWFIHLILHSTLSYTPLGRVDQYLWPYYKADIDSGAITKEYARELLGSFFIKFNERTQFLQEHMENHLTDYDWSQGGGKNESAAHFNMENDADYTYGQSANHWLQSATVGGYGPDGKDATNELSEMILEVINYLELISPMLTARVHSESPESYLTVIAEELTKGGAQPTIFNDEVILKGMIERLKIPKEDALDYSSDGCWEVLVYGKTEYNYGHIEVLPAMEALINNGKSLVTGHKLGIDIGDGIKELDTFDAFFKAYMDQIKYRVDSALRNKLEYYDYVHQIAPEPFLSAFVPDCISKGLDLTNKGARYRMYALFPTGLSHAIDSLNAVRDVVYEKQMVDLPTFIDAVKKNWEGYEELRQYCFNKTPKYGNDTEKGDDLMVRFLDDFCKYTDYWNSQIDWMHITAGVSTFENFPRFGNNAWASFDGRFARETVSSNYSPSFGQDKNGPTAVVLSSIKFDLSRLDNGCPIDMRISFNKGTKEENASLLKNFIKGFIQVGGNIVTITRVDLETLRKAQKEPEKYLSLRVRLGGLTVYFVQLVKKQQDEYMRRTQHAM
ncbi:MAG: pyruvate formate lyase family protein [Sphaerochaetaceae bacterium]